jgi:tyrosine aminotransferase
MIAIINKSNINNFSDLPPEIRKCVATRYSKPEAPLTGDDVIITSGASHAIELCITALAVHGSNILLPGNAHGH